MLLPKSNEPDLADLPPSVREEMEFVLLDRMEDIFAAVIADFTAPSAPVA